MVALAAVNRRLRNRVTSSIGWATRLSQTANALSAPTEMQKNPTTAELVQPWLGASMIAVISVTSPTTDNTAPRQSTVGASGSFDSGTSVRAATTASSAIGTFT